jgi:hypothetical protein
MPKDEKVSLDIVGTDDLLTAIAALLECKHPHNFKIERDCDPQFVARVVTTDTGMRCIRKFAGVG